MLQIENYAFLAQELDELKFRIECPTLYVSDHFGDLRQQIDEAFVRKLSQDTSLDAKLKKEQVEPNWIEMIDLVNKLEQECLKNAKKQLNNEVLNEIYIKIETIQHGLKQTMDFSLLSDFLYETKFLLEKNLFLNKSLIFFDRSLCSNSELFKEMNSDTTVGKLLFITNQYLGTKSIEILKNDETNFCIQEQHSNELLKLKELIKNFEKKSNQIEEFSINYTKLTNIHLSFHNLCHVDKTLFNDLKNLTAIYLGYNRLTEIDSELFAGLINLTIIDVCSNQLIHIGRNAFKGLANLKKLILQENKLEELDKELFRDLVSLTSVSLHHNKLKHVDKDMFKGLTSLVRIDMHRNQFKSRKLELALEKNVKFVSFKNRKCNNINSIVSSKSDLNEQSGLYSILVNKLFAKVV